MQEASRPWGQGWARSSLAHGATTIPHPKSTADPRSWGATGLPPALSQSYIHLMCFSLFCNDCGSSANCIPCVGRDGHMPRASRRHSAETQPLYLWNDKIKPEPIGVYGSQCLSFPGC